MPLLDGRPPAVDTRFRPGNTFTVTFNWPAGSLTGRTFTAALDATSLTLNIAGDDMVVSMTEAQTLAAATVGEFVLTETTGGASDVVIVGSWHSSNGPSAGETTTVSVNESAGVVTINTNGLPGTVGALTVTGDATVGPAAIAGGVATGGAVNAHSLQASWSYTQADNPTDPVIGTAVHVPVNVTLNGGNPPLVGPQLSTGLPAGGPRGILNVEGVARYTIPQQGLGPSPITYADSLTIAAQGTCSRLVPGLELMNFRCYVADGRATTLSGDPSVPIGTDPLGYGSGFCDQQVFATTDTGTLDGTTDSFTLTSFFSQPILFGNTSIFRRVGAMIVGTAFNAGGSAHWSGVGTIDAENCALTEDIGVWVRAFTNGTTNIGVWSEPAIIGESGVYGGRDASDNLTLASTMHATRGHVRIRDHLQIFSEDFTNTTADPVYALEVPAARTITLNDAAGFKTGSSIGGYTYAATVVFQQVGALGIGNVMAANPILKNPNAAAKALTAYKSFLAQPTIRGDGAALTLSEHVGFSDNLTADVINAGTVTVTDAIGFKAFGLTVGASTTVTTRRGLIVEDGTGAGAIGTQVGVDIAALAKGGTANIGIRNASTEVATPSVATITAAGNTITPNAKVKRLNNTSGGAITLTSAPTIPDGQNGQILVLFNSSAQNVVVQDQGTLANSNLRLEAASVTLGPRDSLMLLYSSDVGDWIQLGQAVNVL